MKYWEIAQWRSTCCTRMRTYVSHPALLTKAKHSDILVMFMLSVNGGEFLAIFGKAN